MEFQEKELRAKEEAEATQSPSTVSTNVSRDASCLPCLRHALFPSPYFQHEGSNCGAAEGQSCIWP